MREFFAGLVSGLAFIGMGHPFDTIKTRLQSPSGIHYRGLTDCAFKIFQREGVLAFYRGVVPVLVSKPYIHAASFTLVHTYQSFFDGLLDGNATSQQKGKKCDLSRVAVSGALTGATLSIFVTPTELLKIRLQSRPDKVSLRTIVGFFSGGEFRVSHLLQGIRPTIARNAVGWGSFFWCSEYMKQMFRSFESHKSGPAETRDPPSEIHLGKVQLLISGGIAGGISTLLSLPADVIKTRLQAQSFQNREYSGMVDCARKSFVSVPLSLFFIMLIDFYSHHTHLFPCRKQKAFKSSTKARRQPSSATLSPVLPFW
eukprot:Sdes_comp19067_c0_seq3m9668